jgi:hypothetical protein
MMGNISHFRATPDENMQVRRSLRWDVFRGWRALILTQDALELTVVPSIGGRLMSLRHAGVELAYVNDALAGKTPDGSAGQWQALCGEWGFPLWGGGKTWVAPESDWPDGAPQRDLDSGSFEVLSTWCGPESMGVDIRLGRADDAWHEAIVPFPGKGPIGDVRGSRFVGFVDGVLSATCDEAIEFKLGIRASQGELDVRLALPEGEKRLTRSFDAFADRPYLHGAPIEVFNAPALPYFEIESHGPAQNLAPGAACDLRVRERIS